MKTTTLIMAGVFAVMSAAVTFAGNLNAPGAPGATNSYKMDDIYNRLNNGTTGTQGTFTGPPSGAIGGTGHTLDEIYNLIGTRAFVPKTGQTGCWDAAGTSIACGGTGQDGEKLRGVSSPSPRFTDNSNGTVTDNLTGLIWLKNANCANAARTWATALTDVASLNSAGTMNGNNCGDTSSSGSHQTDWRLPNRNELNSLIHAGYSNPALSNTAGTGQWTAGNPFTGVQSGYYWSATTYAGNPTYAWRVDLSGGGVYAVGKSYTVYVWPVRGGQ